ncbi:MAG: lipopolysaccharide heptosyltransferase II [Deltaproteobacteria bacterium]|nr:lipopolysaccharide heptosyltransferase II [Candidatus Anaeroferrophillacea bacterium]
MTDRNTIARILVRGTNWIGDAVMTTPALAALRRRFPGAEIVMLANPPVAALFSPHPAVNRVMVYDKSGMHRGVAGRRRLCRKLRAARFDLALLLQNAFEAALIARIAGIPRRAGYATDGRGFLLTDAVAIGAGDRRLHHTAYYLELLRRLGLADAAAGTELSLQCTPEESLQAQRLLSGRHPVVINPGAAYGSAKRWLPERFAAVADTLAREYSVPIVITGGPEEVEIAGDIAAAMTHDAMNLAGKTSVRELLAVLAEARLMVTNDSGPMHVAAAFGVPVVAVFGPTDHTTTSPAAGAVRIVRRPVNCAPCLKRQCPTDHRCMTAITATDVIAASRELLEPGAA